MQLGKGGSSLLVGSVPCGWVGEGGELWVWYMHHACCFTHVRIFTVDQTCVQLFDACMAQWVATCLHACVVQLAATCMHALFNELLHICMHALFSELLLTCMHALFSELLLACMRCSVSCYVLSACAYTKIMYIHIRALTFLDALCMWTGAGSACWRTLHRFHRHFW